MPYNFVGEGFQTTKICAILHRKPPFCFFEPHIGGLGATYDVHLRLIKKRVGDLVLIELFC